MVGAGYTLARPTTDPPGTRRAGAGKASYAAPAFNIAGAGARAI